MFKKFLKFMICVGATFILAHIHVHTTDVQSEDNLWESALPLLMRVLSIEPWLSALAASFSQAELPQRPSTSCGSLSTSLI